jgi:hypothetical protein
LPATIVLAGSNVLTIHHLAVTAHDNIKHAILLPELQDLAIRLKLLHSHFSLEESFLSRAQALKYGCRQCSVQLVV